MTRRQANTLMALGVATVLTQILCTAILLRGYERATRQAEAAEEASVAAGVQAEAVSPALATAPAEGRRAAASGDITALAGGLWMYYSDIGHYPSTNQGLAALIRNVGNEPDWKGPYLHNASDIPTDPWGQAYRYTVPGPGGPGFVIATHADGKPISSQSTAGANR